ncbi:MAG TPA: heavy metal-binding domain-containing protein [Acidimicrobiales bacterium]|nr:heavy metal-binding domain-containing protein [Acidimicrobiales bacterium]
MTPGPSGEPAPLDLQAEVRRAAHALAHPGQPGGSPGATSDLSVDEALLLHSVGWEVADLVCGVSVYSVPVGVWSWGQGEIGAASAAHRAAFQGAAARLAAEGARAGGHGVVGVRVGVEVRPHSIHVELVGTAARPAGPARPGRPFVSDLSGRDFALLLRAGWMPVGLAFGASFVYAPRRSAATVLAQKAQNVELTNLTNAMYSARESAMARMQESALDMGGQGVVAVTVTEGPMGFARHAVGFSAWGTVVRLEASSHRTLAPRVVVPLDDPVVTFEAEALRGS